MGRLAREAALAVVLTVLMIGPLAPLATAQVRKLGGEFLANSYTVGPQQQPAVATLGNEGFIVAWVGDNPLTPKHIVAVRGQRFARDGSPVGSSEFLISTGQTMDLNAETEPSIASAADGSFVVAWQSYYDGDDSEIFAQRFDSNGAAIGTNVKVNEGELSERFPQVSSSAAGEFVVTWREKKGYLEYGGVTRGRRFNSLGEAAGSEFAVSAETDYSIYGSVAHLSNDEFVIVWAQAKRNEDGYLDGYGDSLGVRAQRFGATGERLGADDFLVNTYTSGTQRRPDVAQQSGKGFVVVWQSYREDFSGFGVFGQRFDNEGQRLGSPFQANTYWPYHQALPSVATDAQGNFVVVWESYASGHGDDPKGQDGSGRGIFGQLFDADGTRRGFEFQVNTYTTGNQGYRGARESAVAMYPDGDFVVVWTCPEDHDGSFTGVFGQRFHVDRALGTLCGDAAENSDLRLTVTDALWTLKTAVGLKGCLLCICDANDSGSITASDALEVLKAAVQGSQSNLKCPGCEESSKLLRSSR